MRKLAIVDKEKIDSKIEHLKKIEQKKYPFKPQLNEKSKQLARRRNLDDIVDMSEKEQRMIAKKKQAEDYKMKECSFRPKINKGKKFKKVESHYSQKNYERKMDEYLKKKQMEVSEKTNFRGIFCQERKSGTS